MVSQLLLDGPVQVLKVRLTDCGGRLLAGGLQGHTQLDVEVVRIGMGQIRQGLWVLRGVGHFERLERFHGHHPRTDAGAHVLGQERSQWNVFPLLNVTTGR